MKTTLVKAVNEYRNAYKAFHGYEPNVNRDMTVRELIAHAKQFRLKYIEREMETDSEIDYPYGSYRGEN